MTTEEIKELESKLIFHRKHVFDDDGEEHEKQIAEIKAKLQPVWQKRSDAVRAALDERFLFRWL